MNWDFTIKNGRFVGIFTPTISWKTGISLNLLGDTIEYQ